MVIRPATSGTAATERDVAWQLFHDPASVHTVRRRLWPNHDPFLVMRANPTTGPALVT